MKHFKFLFLFIFLLTVNGYTQKITKGPFLVEPGDTVMLIRWETDQPVGCSVKFGQTDALDSEVKAELRGEKYGGYLYQATLVELEQDSDYFYQVFAGESISGIKKFRTTSPNADRMRFVAMGDSRSNPDIFKKIIDNMQVTNPDFIISMGDLVANGGTYTEWEEFYFSVAGVTIDHVPLVSTLGDHEGSGDEGELFRHFLRTDQPTEKQWFSFNYGNAHFISLDYRHPDSEEMISWFKEDIESADAKWNFVYMHRPCYNLGGHRSAWGRDKWPELFRQYRVDIVFAGHSHQYERFHPIRPVTQPDSHPVTYITTGGAGAGLYDVTQNPYLARAESVNHYVDFEISGDTLRAKAIRNDNTLLDEFRMIKSKDNYDDNYLALTMPQENLDILTMFTRAASFSIETIPLDDHPSRAFVNLKSTIADDIGYIIKLSEASQPFYQMESVSDSLKGYENKQIPLSILSKTDMTVSRWGDIKPELIITITYKYKTGEYTIHGGAIEYSPNEDY
jgi:predicted phosphodiesterase